MIVLCGMAAFGSGGWGGAALAATDSGAESDAARIERGRILAAEGNCESCHTAEDGEPYAGGFVVTTPFGNLIGPNITSDPETGIGDWTLEAFDAAVRDGIRPDGAPLYPAMPYTSFTRMTDADLEALWAYMQTVPPVHNAVEVNQLPFPFDVRASLWFWRTLYYDPGRFEPDPDVPDRVQRGRYLVEGVAHCGACHTPRDALGGSDSGAYLTGASLGRWYAPDISGGADSVLRNWTEDSLTDFLMREHTGRNVPAFGEMAHVTETLSEVPREDVSAMAAYLMSQLPESETTPDTAGETAADPADTGPDDDSAGARLYARNCEGCHGADGLGARGVAARLPDNGGVVAEEPTNVLTALLAGLPPKDVYGVMPSFAESLSDAEIAAVANYVRTAWGNDAPANATRGDVADLRAEVGPPSPEVERAATCPPVPADWVDTRTRAEIGRIVQSNPGHLPDEAGLRGLWDGYLERVPGLSVGERVTALRGVYCTRIAGLNDLTTGAVFAHTVTFSARVGRLAVPEDAAPESP
ncbi:cytochrome c [Roseospira marina]|nr:c-type cytochrome [Roseospira marina]